MTDFTFVDDVRDVKVDNSNNLYVVGSTFSWPFPLSSGTTIQPFNNGKGDGFIAKFNNTTDPGVLLWSTFIGGEQQDYLNSVDIGPDGNIYSVGATASYNTVLPSKIKSGAAWIQGWTGPLDSLHNLPSKIPTWHLDGLLAEVNPSGDTLKWLTRVSNGSSQHDDALYKGKFDPYGNFYAVGYTRSPNMWMLGAAGSYTRTWANAGATHTMNVTDGWITKFNTSGAWVWSTTFGASTTTLVASDDYLLDLAFNSTGDVYVGGYTEGNNTIVSGGGAAYQGAYDGIIARFNSSCVLQWSTHLGGPSYDQVFALNTNTYVGSNLYVTGIGEVGFPTNNGGYYYDNSHNGGTDDVFFSVYNSSNTRTHSTFIGGNKFDEGHDIEIDNSGIVYISGKTTSTNFYTPSPNNGYNATPTGVGLDDLFLCALYPGLNDLLWTGVIGSDGADASGYVYNVSMAVDNSQSKLYFGSMAKHTLSPVTYPILGATPTFTKTWSGNFDGSLSRFDLATLHSLVGIDEIKKLSNDVFVYPNPTYGIINVKIANFNDKYNYVVYNTLGQLILSGKLYEQDNQIDLTGLKTGMYFLELNNGKEKLSAKIIKQE